MSPTTWHHLSLSLQCNKLYAQSTKLETWRWARELLDTLLSKFHSLSPCHHGNVKFKYNGKITKQNCSKKSLLNFVEAQSNVNLRRVRLKILRDCAPHWLAISIVHKHIKVIWISNILDLGMQSPITLVHVTLFSAAIIPVTLQRSHQRRQNCGQCLGLCSIIIIRIGALTWIFFL